MDREGMDALHLHHNWNEHFLTIYIFTYIGIYWFWDYKEKSQVVTDVTCWAILGTQFSSNDNKWWHVTVWTGHLITLFSFTLTRSMSSYLQETRHCVCSCFFHWADHTHEICSLSPHHLLNKATLLWINFQDFFTRHIVWVALDTFYGGYYQMYNVLCDVDIQIEGK